MPRIPKLLLLLSLSTLAFGWGAEDRLDNPVSRGLSLAQLLNRHLLVDFVRREDVRTWRLDEEVYTDQRIIGILMERYSVGSSQRIAARHERQSRLSAATRSPIARPQRRDDGVLIAQHPVQGCIRVAVEDYPDLAERYDVTSVPTFLVLNQSGEVVARHEGLLEADRMARFLEEAVARSAPPAVIPAPGQGPVAPSPIPTPTPTVRISPALESLPIGTGRTGSITRDRRRIEYLLDDTARPLRVSLQTMTPGVDLDLAVLPLTGEDAAPIAEGTTPTGVEEILVDAPGPLRVRVFLYGENIPEGGASYTVTADTGAPEEAVAEAEELPDGASVWGRVGEGRWERFYSFRAEAGAPYTLSLRAEDTSVDIDIEILDSVGNVVSRSNGGTGVEEISRSEDAAGEFLVRVYAYTPASPVNFSLRRSAGGGGGGARPPRTVTPAEVTGDLELGVPVDGRVEQSGELIYRFRAARAGLYTFLLMGEESAGDIDLAVLDAEGNSLATSQGGAATEAILLTLAEGVEVHVRVYAYALTAPASFKVWVRSAE